MISRRKVLESGALAAVAVALPFGRMRTAYAQTVSTFDFYISPKGDDNNPGTLASPWSITALNSKMTTYAGKRVGIIGDQGIVNSGRVGGAVTTLYSLYQALPGNGAQSALLLNGGSASAPTYIASCDSTGTYKPRLAIIDASDPSTGAKPTANGPLFGQNQYQPTVEVPNFGNVTIDALVIRNFTAAGIMFYGSSSTQINNVVIKNCEIYGQQNVISNGNPGAIRFDFANNAVVTNCCIHDLKTNGAGTSYQMQACGVITFDSYGTNITNCTFYNCCAVSSKDGWQQMNVSYCYLGWGTFGSPYSGAADTTNLGGTVHNYLTGTGMVNEFHHNIVLGPILSWGESSQENEGLVKIYNNTFYEPVVGGANYKMATLINDKGNAGGAWGFYNNLVYSEVGYENGNNCPGALVMYNANTTPSIFTTCDYNAYGSGMTFGTGWSLLNLGIAAWRAFGFDAHSVILTGSPFAGTPAEPNAESFAIIGPAKTAGVGGAACGAMDGTGLVGCDFVGQVVPDAPVLGSVT